MNKLYARLFGKFTVAVQPHTPMILEGAKVQELFSYLLLYRNRPHTREVLATMLWCDASASQCKSYLRKTLWQLQSELEQVLDGCLSDFLHVDGEWVQLNTGDRLWLDVAQFEQTFAQVKEMPGQTWDEATAQQVATAVDLYRSDLLEGAYQEWCLFERERLQRLYLIMLEKLMNYCEAGGHYETGIGYGMQVLRYDLARENSHRSLMRLHYLAGNRSEALRQYERCAKILREELAVEPGRRTKALYEQMVAEELPQGQDPEGQRVEETAVFSPECSLRQTLQQLETLRSLLSETQHQIQQNIALVEATLHKIPPHPPQDRSEIRFNNAAGYGHLLAYAPESSINS